MTQNNTWKHKKYFEYKDELRRQLPGFVLPEVLRIEFHFAIAKSHSSRKLAEMLNQYHQQRPDIDNLIKGFMDAFRTEDAHVAVVHAGKYWSDIDKIIVVLDN
jgi:Holliday junction resolvase RusA-like endonuclease